MGVFVCLCVVAFGVFLLIFFFPENSNVYRGQNSEKERPTLEKLLKWKILQEI